MTLQRWCVFNLTLDLVDAVIDGFWCHYQVQRWWCYPATLTDSAPSISVTSERLAKLLHDDLNTGSEIRITPATAYGDRHNRVPYWRN